MTSALETFEMASMALSAAASDIAEGIGRHDGACNVLSPAHGCPVHMDATRRRLSTLRVANTQYLEALAAYTAAKAEAL